jgi:hypothetical protein
LLVSRALTLEQHRLTVAQCKQGRLHLVEAAPVKAPTLLIDRITTRIPSFPLTAQSLGLLTRVCLSPLNHRG